MLAAILATIKTSLQLKQLKQMKSWSSTKFLQEKKQELLEAAKQLHNDYATVEEISKYVSLANGVKKCFLQAGILIKGAKVGKAYLLKIDVFKCNEETIRLAYSYKEQHKKSRISFTKIQKVRAIAAKEGLKTSTETKKIKKKDIFPSVEDCVAFLKHHYGMKHEVILVPEGFKLDSFTVKVVSE